MNPIPSDLLDAGKRASDIANTCIVSHPPEELRNKYAAFRLDTGDWDGTLYDTRRDAIRHQLDEFRCAYFSFRNCLNGTTAREMAIFLQFNRDAYKAGFRLPDPDDFNGGKETLVTSGQHDYYRNLINNAFTIADMKALRELAGR